MKNRIRNGPFEPIVIDASNPRYPSGLRDRPPDSIPPRLWAIGDLRILENPLLGFLCSSKCPGQVILRVYDLARTLRDAGVAVISGFHSPMEKECLELLLRGDQPVVVCPGRGLHKMRMPSAWRKALTENRLLLLSTSGPEQRRSTRALAERRNSLVAAIADPILVAHASEGGKIEQLCLKLLSLGRRIYTLDLDANIGLTKAGAIYGF